MQFTSYLSILIHLYFLQGSGAYSQYTGGRVDEIVESTDPVYSSRITLIPPVKSDDAANDTMVDSNMTTESKTAQSSTSINTAGSGMAVHY